MSRSPGVALSALLALLALAASGCASSPRPAATAPAPVRPEAPVQPATEPAPEAAPAESAAGAEATPEEPAGAYGPKTIVIDQPEPEEVETRTLADAARQAKEGRAGEGTTPIAVITNETLPDYATGQLSIAAEKPVAEGAGGTAGETATPRPETASAEAQGEEYWRNRVRDARLRWRDLLEEITRLESEVATLRQRFYAEDDGFYRDSQIKPAWDRALDRLAGARDEVGRARENLESILQEGRLAGALPGWLREGIEYQPAVEEPEEEPGIHEASEPQVIDDDGGNQ